MRTEDQKTRARLRREAYRLAQETYDREVSYDRLVVIRDRLRAIDEVLSSRVARPQGS
ncbi:hypothetical protein [Brevundimonas subvibrioides]|uniref:hypothetical protein n=1 Tax=Brevundimonas subvibrioides TaxID=74313 RepID=UPI0022B35D0B|nr:hypothetical protein [Brevundimonas subvibrioides]